MRVTVLFLFFTAAAAGADTPAITSGVPPATVALVIDTSGSIRAPELARTQQIASGTLQALPRGSQIAVFGFDDQSRLLLPRTDREDEIRQAIQGLHSGGHYTALYDALYDASRYLRDAPGARKAIVLITDGKDENSALNLEDGLRIAQDSGLPVFAVGVGRIEERILRRIAKLSGGAFSRAESTSGGEIASAILEAAAQPAASATGGGAASPTPVARPELPRVAGPRAVAPSAAPGPRWWPWAAVALVLLAVTGAGLASRGRRQPLPVPNPSAERTAPPIPAAATAPRPPPALQPTSASGEIESPTLVMRAPDDEEAGHTLVLRAWSVLAVTEGPAAGQAFELSHEATTSIGRGLSNDIVLDDPAVSSQHCRIRPEAEGFVLHDLDSTNGTFVNDRRISRHVLAEGDQIRIGESLLQYRTDQRRG